MRFSLIPGFFCGMLPSLQQDNSHSVPPLRSFQWRLPHTFSAGISWWLRNHTPAFLQGLPASSGGEALGGHSAGWPVLFLNNRIHPIKAAVPAAFIGCIVIWLFTAFLRLKRAEFYHPKPEKAGALQSTFIVKRSTPAKMYVSLSITVF